MLKYNCTSMSKLESSKCTNCVQVNLLSVVLNAAPITPEEDEDTINLMKDSPQCMTFVLFMIW